MQLEVLAALDRHCREQGLTYYLGYGTLLGAVRHGGFIPWDDDVDVMMPRADYERLRRHLRRQRPRRPDARSPRTQAGWPLPYAKVSDDRTVLVEPFEVPVAMGVNVDVFPLDPVPSSPLRPRVQAVLLRRLGWALELQVHRRRARPRLARPGGDPARQAGPAAGPDALLVRRCTALRPAGRDRATGSAYASGSRLVGAREQPGGPRRAGVRGPGLSRARRPRRRADRGVRRLPDPAAGVAAGVAPRVHGGLAATEARASVAAYSSL